jgi:hypothetical protein
MIKKLYDFLKRGFEPTDCMSQTQKVALKNIISAARERVWLAEPLYPMLKTDTFTRDVSSEAQTAIIDSANIIEHYLHEQNKPTN